MKAYYGNIRYKLGISHMLNGSINVKYLANVCEYETILK